MRGMNRYYHERFFSDVRFTTVSAVALFVLGFWEVPLAFLLIPPVALLGAAQTAFDASYLIFSRHYSETLERYLNEEVEASVLVAHEMENRYLFPLNDRKIVTASFGRDFSWFGFMTLFYTVMGVFAFGFGIALGWDPLLDAGSGWAIAYLASLGALAGVALVTGWWWFVGGAGERRLADVLEGYPK
jgi:hypothetical protein